MAKRVLRIVFGDTEWQVLPPKEDEGEALPTIEQRLALAAMYARVNYEFDLEITNRITVIWEKDSDFEPTTYKVGTGISEWALAAAMQWLEVETKRQLEMIFMQHEMRRASMQGVAVPGIAIPGQGGPHGKLKL